MIFWSIYLPGLAIACILYFAFVPELHKRGPKGIHKIDRDTPTTVLSHEYALTLLSMLIFAATGWLVGFIVERGIAQVSEPEPLTWSSFFKGLAGFFAAIVVHDLYFYLTHRFLHWRPVFKTVHHIHHRSHDTNSWSAFSFHPLEGLIQVGIIPIVALVLPLSETALVVFAAYLILMTVYGHSGYELRSHRLKVFGFFNTAYHHYLHHRFIHCNYGLYLNVWDWVLGTNREDYAQSFDDLARRISDEKRATLRRIAPDEPDRQSL